MSKPVLIGEIDVSGTMMPVFASTVLVDRLLRVEVGYTGDDDTADKASVLLDEASASLRSGRTQFSHMVRDRAWRGDPEKIESERVNVSIAMGLRSLTLGYSVRKIAKRGPRFQQIANDALVAMNKYECRRDV